MVEEAVVAVVNAIASAPSSIPAECFECDSIEQAWSMAAPPPETPPAISPSLLAARRPALYASGDGDGDGCGGGGGVGGAGGGGCGGEGSSSGSSSDSGGRDN